MKIVAFNIVHVGCNNKMVVLKELCRHCSSILQKYYVSNNQSPNVSSEFTSNLKSMFGTQKEYRKEKPDFTGKPIVVLQGGAFLPLCISYAGTHTQICRTSFLDPTLFIR